MRRRNVLVGFLNPLLASPWLFEKLGRRGHKESRTDYWEGANTTRAASCTCRESMYVEGHVLLLCVGYIQQVGSDRPIWGVCTEVQ
jgi:hypothetical protein